MKKGRLIWNVLVFAIVLSCKKEAPDDVPDYRPGALTEVSYETPDLGITYHRYEYKDNEVTDYYFFTATEVFISKYFFKKDKLEKVYYSFENSNEVFYIDSLKYFYSDSLILELNYYNDSTIDTIVYRIESGKIVSSTNRPDSLNTESGNDRYFRWDGENLIQYIEHDWIGGICFQRNFILQYSILDNPLCCCNIPKVLNVFIPPRGGKYFELADLVPKCSKNFPSKITVYYNYIPELQDIYRFESKKFQNANKPFKVKVVHTEYFIDSYEYFLTYEEL